MIYLIIFCSWFE